jgi:hypothetical protein
MYRRKISGAEAPGTRARRFRWKKEAQEFHLLKNISNKLVL